MGSQPNGVNIQASKVGNGGGTREEARDDSGSLHMKHAYYNNNHALPVRNEIGNDETFEEFGQYVVHGRHETVNPIADVENTTDPLIS
ncbi:hypothetical protein ACOSQ4_015428 [Xanthoceras sorbifolium]